MTSPEPHRSSGSSPPPSAAAFDAVLRSGRGVGPSTAAVHAGEARQKLANAITDPIVTASTYTFPNTRAILDFIEQDLPREEYGRYGNPGECRGITLYASLDNCLFPNINTPYKKRQHPKPFE